MLPYTAEVLLSFLAGYNRALWPLQPLAVALGLAALVLLYRGWSGGNRVIASILAAAWAWVGAAYFLTHLALIDFAAAVVGWVFLLQSGLLAWRGVLAGKLVFERPAGLVGWVGLALALVALLVQPLIGLLAGQAWASAGLFGLTPGPTVLFTLGLLLLAKGRERLFLAVVPLLWCLAGGALAWELGLPQDMILPLAALAAVGLLAWPRRRPP